MSYERISHELLEKIIEIREQSAAFSSEDNYNNSLLGIRDEKDEAHERIMKNFEMLSYEWACKVIGELCKKHSIEYRLWVTAYDGLEYTINHSGKIILGAGRNTNTERIKVPFIGEGGKIKGVIETEGINQRDTITLNNKEYDLRIRPFSFPGIMSKKIDKPRIMVYLIDNSPKSIKLIEKWNERSQKEFGGLIENYTFYDFVEKFFGNEELSELKEAVLKLRKAMRNKIGSRLTDICDKEAKQEFKENFKHELAIKDYRSLIDKYLIVGNEEDNLYEEDFEIIQNHFINDERYLALVGESEFAQSLFTAEWLYKKYSSQVKLDNTFLVAGYIKSIEQLLWQVIYMIARGRQIGPPGHVEIIGEEAEEIRATLENICYFIKRNADLCDYDFNRSHRRLVVDYLVKYISDYKNNCRNGYFHKDNMSQKKVDEIRDKTHILYYLILGIFRLDEDNLRDLGIN